jgi:hypothetical protein
VNSKNNASPLEAFLETLLQDYALSPISEIREDQWRWITEDARTSGKIQLQFSGFFS